MLRILGSPTRMCDGITRRELMHVGALSLFGGLTLPRLLRAEEGNRRDLAGASPDRLEGTARSALRPASAKSVILFNLLGVRPSWTCLI